MMKSVDNLIRLFREKGFKITAQRRLIFELLAGDDSHPTAEEIYERVISVMPEVSRTTVYNTLRELVALGELTEVDDPNQSGTRYDTNPGHHHHLFCMRCGALTDVARDFESVRLSPEEAEGYRIVKSQVTFYGYCPKCQRAQRNRRIHPKVTRGR